MKPRFEEHEGQLFRMLEKPVPLTADAELPCLTRLIQDDSRMGMFNRDTKPNRLSDFYLAARIVNNNIIVDEFMESDYHRFEIIGYPVAEGSAEWALYSAMNGKSFVHKDAKQCRIFTMFSERELRVSDGEGETVEYVEIDEFLNDASKTGWQLYKEPEPAKEPIADCDNCKHRCAKRYIDDCQMYEPRPEQKPFPSFEVGDWVEVECQNKLYHKQVLFVTENRVGFKFSGTTPSVCFDGTPSHIFKFIRKLAPSQVVIHIGCLSGTVRPVSINGIHIWFHLIGVDDKTIATIRISSLDTSTRELVESLLKAQGEEE